MSERAFHLPGVAPRTHGERFGTLELEVPDLSPEEIRALLARLRSAAPGPPSEVSKRADALAVAAGRFLRAGDPLRRLAIEVLPATCGFSREMIVETLPLLLAPFTLQSITRAVSATPGEILSPLAIVSAGNLPGVALPKMALALAAGGACLVKTASGEPFLPVLFARAVAEEDPDLGARLAVVWWHGGEAAWEAELAAGVASLVAYGSDEATAALRRSAPEHFLSLGHRLSVAVVRLDPGAAIERLAAGVALDVALYDQLGCLSPQCVYGIGEDAARRTFGDALARSLEALAARLPRGHVPELSSVAIRRLRDEYEWRETGGLRARVLVAARGTDWTVIEDPEPRFRSTPLYRTVFLRPLGALADLPAALGEALRQVECVGIGPWPDAEAAGALAEWGIPRVAPIGRMQVPGLDWRQGGSDPMTGIVDEGEGTR